MSNPKPVVEPVAQTTELAVGSNTSEQPAVVFVWPKKSPSGSIDAEAAGEPHHIGDEIIQRPRSPPRPQRSDSSNWDSSSDADDSYPPLYAVKMLISFFTFGEFYSFPPLPSFSLALSLSIYLPLFWFFALPFWDERIAHRSKRPSFRTQLCALFHLWQFFLFELFIFMVA